MPTPFSIYLLKPSLADDYPHVDWTLPANARVGTQLLQMNDRLKTDGAISAYPNIALTLSKSSRQPDFLHMSPGMAISERARACFDALQVKSLRFIPLASNRGDYWLVFTERVLDCLDLQRTRLKRFSTPPYNVMKISEYCFRAGVIEPLDLFSIAEQSTGFFFAGPPLFITSETREQIEAACLYEPSFTEIGTVA